MNVCPLYLFLAAVEAGIDASPESGYTTLVDKIVTHGEPEVKATVPTTSGVFDKLLDTNQYTGGTIWGVCECV